MQALKIYCNFCVCESEFWKGEVLRLVLKENDALHQGSLMLRIRGEFFDF